MKINKQIFLAIFGATFFLNPVFGMEEKIDLRGSHSDTEINETLSKKYFEDEDDEDFLEIKTTQEPVLQQQIHKKILISDHNTIATEEHTQKEKDLSLPSSLECDFCHKPFVVYNLLNNKIPPICTACFKILALLEKAEEQEEDKQQVEVVECKICNLFYKKYLFHNNPNYPICDICIDLMEDWAKKNDI